jgi:Cu/Ag efflux protein CusF
MTELNVENGKGRRQMTQKMIPLVSVLLVAMLLAALAPAARAQALVHCSITAIDARTSVVSAKVNASGAVFQFRITDAALLKSLKVGQEVYANFTTKQVSLDGKKMLGEIISPPQAAAPVTAPKIAPAAASAAAPVAVGGIQNKLGPVQSCTITAINTYTGVVSAKENATGQIITFQIAHFKPIDGAKLFQTFKVGDRVDLTPIDGAALTSGSNVRVTVQGLTPIDGIVASIGAAAGSGNSGNSGAPTSSGNTNPQPVSFSCGGTANPLSADTCGKLLFSATNFGITVTCGASVTITGTIVPVGDDWLVFTVPPSRANCADYSGRTASPPIQASISSTPAGAICFDVLQTAGTPVLLAYGPFPAGETGVALCVPVVAGLGLLSSPLQPGQYYIRIHGSLASSTGAWTLKLKG